MRATGAIGAQVLELAAKLLPSGRVVALALVQLLEQLLQKLGKGFLRNAAIDRANPQGVPSQSAQRRTELQW